MDIIDLPDELILPPELTYKVGEHDVDSVETDFDLIVKEIKDHTNTVELRKTEKPYACYCGKVFASLRQCYGHQRVHSKEKLWSCEKCPEMGFMTKKQLITHQTSHGLLQRTQRCPKCEMMFLREAELKRHIRRIHDNERFHKCGVCGKSFFEKLELKFHMAVHNGKKQYQCKVCDKTFCHVSNLLRHARGHTNFKPYICSICQKRFTQVNTLNQHLKKKHLLHGNNDNNAPMLGTPLENTKTQRRYHCTHCGETLKYHSDLMHHLASIHDIDNRPESANDMLNEVVQDFNKNSSHLGESVDALIRGILSEDTNDSIITNNVHSLHSNIKDFHDSTTATSCVLKTLQLHNDQSDGLSNTKKLDEVPFYFNVKSYDQDVGNNAKNEIQNIDHQNLLNSALNVDNILNCDNSNSSDLRNTYNELGASMLQDIEIYLPPQTNYNSEYFHDNSIENNISDLSDFPVNFSNIETKIEPERIPRMDIDTDCATIFESDVDLEQSSLLAENLNHLIEQNGVQFISADDSDTYIISLNTSMDAEKLSSFLNIDNVEITTVDDLNNVKNIEDLKEVESNMPELENILKENNFTKENNAQIEINLQSKNNSQTENMEIHKDIDCQKKKKQKVEIFTCKICGKTFASKYNYKGHLGIHDIKHRRYKCSYCQKRFSWKSTLNKHIKARHRKQLKVICNICKRSYKTNWQVTEHKKREHEGEKLYHCSESGCTREFFKKHDLIIHIRTHTNERPYACSSCHNRFGHPSHLRRHERAHHTSSKMTISKLVTDGHRLLQITSVRPP